MPVLDEAVTRQHPTDKAEFPVKQAPLFRFRQSESLQHSIDLRPGGRSDSYQATARKSKDCHEEHGSSDTYSAVGGEELSEAPYGDVDGFGLQPDLSEDYDWRSLAGLCAVKSVSGIMAITRSSSSRS